jgi:uncharacterized protein (TIRG00374 family)
MLSPLMVRNRVPLNKGLASVIVDRYADALTSAMLGFLGLLLLPYNWNTFILAGVVGLLISLVLVSLLWIRRRMILSWVEHKGNKPLIEVARALYDAAESMENPLKLIVIAVLISLIIWVPYALRIYYIALSLGYAVPIYLIFFLQPIVSLLTVIPITIAGLGLSETGMALLMVSLGFPAPLGVSIAILDRAIGMGGDAIFGLRYSVRLLREGLSYEGKQA